MTMDKALQTHAIYLDQNRKGEPRVSITWGRKGSRGAGKANPVPDRDEKGHRIPPPLNHTVELLRYKVENSGAGPTA